MKTWEVWVEGYSATGDSAPARRLAESIEAETFADACELLLGKDGLFDAERLTYWGCKLFPTELEARKSFG